MKVKKIVIEEVKVPFHNHLVRPFTRFVPHWCFRCQWYTRYVYGGYRCNEPGCGIGVFHKECAEALPEIIHSSHPEHPLKLIQHYTGGQSVCSLCQSSVTAAYHCSICHFVIDLDCVRRSLAENSNLHEHLLKLSDGEASDSLEYYCAECGSTIGDQDDNSYRCHECKYAIHLTCVKIHVAPEAYHTSHPEHPLKLILYSSLPAYAEKNCLLCGDQFSQHQPKIHHCDVCNYSICRECMVEPLPVGVLSSTTHEHQLHLVPRRMKFTCNACGTLGGRSPYFCLLCNFMIHRDCIDLPRIININRHDHRISYIPRLGHGEWKCGVCRKKVDGFYGAYICSKCSTFVVHSRCATRKDVWDMVELEGIPEEEEIDPFEVVDEKTIKHLSHDHNLLINKDGKNLHESVFCEACALQICSESFYSCTKCDFFLHENCANLPQKKRHVCNNQPFTLYTDSRTGRCFLCKKAFSGFRYESKSLYIFMELDARCISVSEPFIHESHPHPLYYPAYETTPGGELSCDECDFTLEFKDALLPKKIMWNRYDDHPLFLSCGEINVGGEYWCEACETKVNPKEWFYTCNDCGITLHVSCFVGDFSYIKPGSAVGYTSKVANTSICRPFCVGCDSRCMLPSILKFSMSESFLYVCSMKCLSKDGVQSQIQAAKAYGSGSGSDSDRKDMF